MPKEYHQDLQKITYRILLRKQLLCTDYLQDIVFELTLKEGYLIKFTISLLGTSLLWELLIGKINRS